LQTRAPQATPGPSRKERGRTYLFPGLSPRSFPERSSDLSALVTPAADTQTGRKLATVAASLHVTPFLRAPAAGSLASTNGNDHRRREGSRTRWPLRILCRYRGGERNQSHTRFAAKDASNCRKNERPPVQAAIHCCTSYRGRRPAAPPPRECSCDLPLCGHEVRRAAGFKLARASGAAPVVARSGVDRRIAANDCTGDGAQRRPHEEKPKQLSAGSPPSSPGAQSTSPWLACGESTCKGPEYTLA